jgi:hypothetical protein
MKASEIKKLRDSYVEELRLRNLFQPQDMAAIENVCKLQHEAARLLDDITLRGATITTKDGEQRNPSLIALNTVTAIIDRELKRLAIGNNHRQKIGSKLQEKRKPSILDLRKKAI